MHLPARPLALALVALGVSTVLAQTRTFTSQYTFGDSLSDSGNLFALTNRTQPPAPYFNGRFSNGPVFTELLGNPIAPAATVSAQRGNLNFAFGGANAGPGGAPIPNLTQQIGMYRLQGLPARPTDVFTVLAGPNDMIAVLGAPTTPGNPASLDAAGANVAQAVATGVQTLMGLGAKNIVVGGLPNLGATPRALATGGPGGAGATFGLRATNAFNHELRSRLQALAAGAPDVNLVFLDLQGIMSRIVSDFEAAGFTNATSFYLAPPAQGGGSGDPNGYIFWDDIHPTARTHALLAAIVVEELNPEPVLGFGTTIGSAALALRGVAANALDTRVAQVAAPKRAVGRTDVYASFQYGDGVRLADDWRPKFGFDAQVVTAGADWRAADGFTLGAALQAGRLDADVRGGRGDFKMEDVSGWVYGIWHGGPVSLTLDGGYGALDVKDIARATSFAGLRTTGKTSGEHWGGGIKVAWAIDGGGFEARPWLAVRTDRVELDAYTERDVPSLNLAFEAQEAKSNTGGLGLDLTTQGKFGGRDLRFDLRAAWLGELGNNKRTLGGRLADNFTRPTLIEIEDGDGDGILVGGAVTLGLGQNWSTSLGYTGEIRSGQKLGSRALLSVQTGF